MRGNSCFFNLGFANTFVDGSSRTAFNESAETKVRERMAEPRAVVLPVKNMLRADISTVSFLNDNSISNILECHI